MALIFLGFGWRFAQFGLDQESELTGINMVSIHIAWPFAGFTWLLVCENQTDAAEATALTRMIWWGIKSRSSPGFS